MWGTFKLYLEVSGPFKRTMSSLDNSDLIQKVRIHKFDFKPRISVFIRRISVEEISFLSAIHSKSSLIFSIYRKNYSKYEIYSKEVNYSEKMEDWFVGFLRAALKRRILPWFIPSAPESTDGEQSEEGKIFNKTNLSLSLLPYIAM